MKMNVIDRVIAFVNPVEGYRRAQYRNAMAIEQSRNYDAAGTGRRNKNRPTHSYGPNLVNQSALHILRARHRDAVRNNMSVAKAVNSIVNNCVGPGIRPSFSGNRNKVIQKMFNEWGEEGKDCDFDNRHTFYGLQALAMRCIVESGEVLIIRKRRSTKGKVPFQLRVVEPDFLDSNRDIRQMADGSSIVQGIQFDKEGKRVGYWLYNEHPNDGAGYRSEFVPAADVIHVYQVLRPGQQRGIPFGASALMRLGDYDDYEDAEVVRQKIAACFAVFIEDASPDIQTGQSSDGNQMLEKVEPGIIEHLAPGRTVKFATPPLTNNFDKFGKRILQGASGAYGITYEAMTGDLSNVNFSSARMGRLEMKAQLITWQQHMLIPQLCMDVMNWFFDAVQLMNGSAYSNVKVTWTAPRMEMVDPWKETNALTAQVRSGFVSHPSAIRELGRDPEDVYAEIIKTNELWDKSKLIFDSDGRHSAGKPEGNQGSGSNQETPNN